MNISGIYKLTLQNSKLGITKEVLASKILPFLIPLSIENGLTLNQFKQAMVLIRDMLNRIETDHLVKLEQLDSMQQQQR